MIWLLIFPAFLIPSLFILSIYFSFFLILTVFSLDKMKQKKINHPSMCMMPWTYHPTGNTLQISAMLACTLFAGQMSFHIIYTYLRILEPTKNIYWIKSSEVSVTYCILNTNIIASIKHRKKRKCKMFSSVFTPPCPQNKYG